MLSNAGRIQRKDLLPARVRLDEIEEIDVEQSHRDTEMNPDVEVTPTTRSPARATPDVGKNDDLTKLTRLRKLSGS